MEAKLVSQYANINKFRKFCEDILNTPEPNFTKGFIEGKKILMSPMWSKLDTHHDEIFGGTTEKERGDLAYFKDEMFENAFLLYDQVIMKMQTKLEEYNKPLAPVIPEIKLPDNLVLNTTNNKSNIKLQPINIPTFSGDYSEWISFKNMFDSLIHNSAEFNDLQRIHYLKSCLAGEAEGIISQFNITLDSYKPAYEALVDRFHNEVVLVDSHLIAILSQPNLTSESGDGIKQLLDVTVKNIQALNVLKIDTTTWDPILLLLLVQKLDCNTRRLWEQSLQPKVRPTFKQFIEFLKKRFYALACQPKFKFSIETSSDSDQQRYNKAASSSNYKVYYQKQQFPPRVHQAFHNATQANSRKCFLRCGGTHNVVDCDRLLKADSCLRSDLIACAKLCKNCLKGHSGRCNLQPGCQKGGQYHHTLLHPEAKENNNATKSTVAPQYQQLETSTKTLSANHALQSNKIPNIVRNETSDVVKWDEKVTLATAVILVRSKRDQAYYPFRALLDSASEASYVSEYATQFLGLTKVGILASTTGLSGVRTGEVKCFAEFEISSKLNPAFHMKVQAPVLSKVTNPLPSIPIGDVDWSHIQGLQLADPNFREPGKIDILLGAAIYGYLLLPGLKKASPVVPVAQNTEFGWILIGATRPEPTVSTAEIPIKPPVVHNISSFHLRIEIDDQLKKFFEQEEVSKERILTQEEEKCEKFFQETYRRNEEGRFVVALPFKDEVKSLGSSKGQAITRLMRLETRFAKNKELKAEYTGILKEYETLKHTTKLGVVNQNTEESSYYLPHHAVFKPESTTTKTRVVFDASAKSTSGKSLNDLLMTGPTLQQELSFILLRWRLYQFVFAADIAKMYRQVEVREEDRKFQKFLYRENENEPIQEYEHNMVTFGVTSATYLAVKALQQLAIEEKKKYPEASEVILRDFYMDDGMSGSDSVQQTIKLCKDLKKVLASGKFDLRKFISNSAEVLESIPEEDRELKLPLEINLNDNIKTLGISYHPSEDIFLFKVNLTSSTEWPTKKSLLSDTARLFDPLWWLAPGIIRAKIMFQQLWQEGLTWEQKLPEQIAMKWMEFRDELKELEKIKINRWIGQGEETKLFELHGFCDSSEAAFSAVVYSRIVNRDNSITVTMLAAKTRVAPIQKVTLPRLELCGAVLLAKLVNNVEKALNVDKGSIHTWTDSMIVLGWLRTTPARLKTYVANRVVEVHNVLNVNQWHHIEGKNNPADCASRGIKPSELKNHDLWWNGPDCLRKHTSSWEQELEIPEVTLELKANKLSTLTVISNQDLGEFFAKYSSFTKLTRITAICLRFIENSRSTKSSRVAAMCLRFINKLRTTKKKIPDTILTVEEIERAKNRLIFLYQQEQFAEEINDLKNRNGIHKKSKILQLDPFLDTNGLLRVGGRLKEANIPYNRKHPIILASGRIVQLIIADAHIKSLHGGTNLTMTTIRESFWVINLRNQVKKHILGCVTCFRFKEATKEQIMANLPEPRVNISVAFTHTGVDYAGPYKMKASNIQAPPTRIKPIVINGEVIKTMPKVPTYEGYIAIFVCLSTKAVHLEAVSDMTTEAFMAALTRFTSRKSCPQHLYSDNGKTFVGAKNVLAIEKEKSLVDYETVAKVLNNEGATWHFIPPKAPHFGGIWEAGVKSMKHHLKRVVGDATLTFEEITTVLARIEACLNSRPLCPLTDDPSDLAVLTPGHFLINKPIIAPPSGSSVLPKKGAFRERWRLQEKIQKDFWKNWSEEYLSRLQSRTKWLTRTENLKLGDMVLLKEDNLPPLKWPLARIIKVYPSDDGEVRSVKIRTATGEYDRPIVKLCLLPISEKENPEVAVNSNQ